MNIDGTGLKKISETGSVAQSSQSNGIWFGEKPVQ
jgi:hypothetical protein